MVHTESRRPDAPPRVWPLMAIAIGVVLLSILGPIGTFGIWDPPELEIAELSRRVAIQLLGADDLILEGADNSPVTRGVLGRGELPFTSIAVGFRLFGLHDWAARLPLAFWGLVGVLATGLLVLRMADGRSAAFAVGVLGTTPFYFVQSRAILGEIVALAAVAMAVSGLGVALFDGSEGKALGNWGGVRLAGAALGMAGLLAGFLSRGALTGVALPTLAIGFCWLLTRGWVTRKEDPWAFSLALLTIGLSIGAAWWGVASLVRAGLQPGRFILAAGAKGAVDPQGWTVDGLVGDLAHGLFPWSALAPLGIAKVLSPPTGISGGQLERESRLRLLMIVLLATAVATQAVLVPVVGSATYPPIFSFAVLIGTGLRDLERAASGSRVIALGTLAILALLLLDFTTLPEKTLVPFGVGGAAFPEGFAGTGRLLFQTGAAPLAVLSFFTLAEPIATASIVPEWRAWKRKLFPPRPSTWLFVLLTLEALLMGLALLGAASAVGLDLGQFAGVGRRWRLLAMVGWIAFPLVLAIVPVLFLALGAAFERLRRASRLSGAVLVWAGAVACGLVLSVGYYPALGRELSPRHVMASYQRLSHAGEPLALFDVGRGSASYYVGGNLPEFDSALRSFEWLTGESTRRWLVVRDSHLGTLNSLYRGLPGRRGTAEGNLPVLGPRSGQILLVSNLLRAGEEGGSPFDDSVRSGTAPPGHPLHAELGGKLQVLGWEIADSSNALVDRLSPGHKYEFRIYWKVVAPLTGEWRTFIHIDGQQRRFNGDHDPLEGRYPPRLWRVGDTIVDRYAFALEPNFSAGRYQVFFGLFVGSRRLQVTRGEHDVDRLKAGSVQVE